MQFSIFTAALLSATAFASEQGKRQATDAAQFTQAADNLISNYIPASALTVLESAIASAASAASVTGDAKSLLYSALLDASAPGWFGSAIPTAWASQVAALTASINVLRASPTGSGPSVPVVVAITTTDSSGSTYTTSQTTTAPIATDTTTSVAVVVMITTTNSVGSTFTTSAITQVSANGTSMGSLGNSTGTATGLGAGAGSTASHLTTQVISGVTSVFTAAVSGASSVASGVGSGGSSVVSSLSSGVSSLKSSLASGASSVLSTGTSSSTAGGCIPTAVSGAAAGVFGFVGMMMAL